MTERLKRSEWLVREIDLSMAQRLIRAHHYARGGSNTATYLHGIFRVGPSALWNENAMGVAWWIPPTKSAAQALAGAQWGGVLSLTRLALEPDVPRNGCSFLLARSVRLIDRARWPVLVTYADSWRGHSGAIYLASGWRFDGETKPEAVYTFSGRMMGRKRGGHTLTHAQMLAGGAIFEGRFAKRRFVHTVAP